MGQRGQDLKDEERDKVTNWNTSAGEEATAAPSEEKLDIDLTEIALLTLAIRSCNDRNSG